MTTKAKIISTIGTLVLVTIIYLGFAFKSGDIKPDGVNTDNAKKHNSIKKSHSKKRATMTWYYNSNSSAPTSITNGSLWTTTDPGHTGCGSANLALPCSLQVDDAVTTTEELDSYFISEYSDDASAIKAAADSRRSVP